MANPVDPLDETIHTKARLGILVVLATEGPLDFPALRAALGLTDGNLSSHLRTLEEAGYVAIQKQFRGRKPSTRIRLTPTGREALETYLEQLARLIQQVLPDGRPRPPT